MYILEVHTQYAKENSLFCAIERRIKYEKREGLLGMLGIERANTDRFFSFDEFKVFYHYSLNIEGTFDDLVEKICTKYNDGNYREIHFFGNFLINRRIKREIRKKNPTTRIAGPLRPYIVLWEAKNRKEREKRQERKRYADFEKKERKLREKRALEERLTQEALT
jgi:hypothetical protein